MHYAISLIVNLDFGTIVSSALKQIWKVTVQVPNWQLYGYQWDYGDMLSASFLHQKISGISI